MMTEEQRAAGVADKVLEHEEAAHEKRNWVRLTFDCNDHCVFCLDTDAHNGTVRDREEVRQQILDGRRKGAERLILSGGEPTIHPSYVDFIRLGRLAGYRWIQTVTNGRLFSYPEFLKKCLDAGLQEITFSIHGPNAKVHDALVGVRGAWDEETRGLHNAVADGRPVVNIDVCVNRANVKHLPEMLGTFISWGVKEFDLLQVIPFGNAFQEGREILFYDLEEAAPHLRKALEYSKRPDVHIWMNRFPPPHLEGYEHLIQDPYKLNDEVKGRKEEYALLTEEGVDLVCREPPRCKHCYLQRLCDTLYGTLGRLNGRRFEVVRVDTEWEAEQGPVWGGDPASRRKAGERPSLRVLGSAEIPPPRHAPLEVIAAEAGVQAVWVRAPDLARALAAAARFPSAALLELELGDYAGLAQALGPGDALGGKTLTRALAADAMQAEALLGVPGAFEVVVALTGQTEPWLLSLEEAPARLVLRQPTYERLSESAGRDVDLATFFATFRHAVPLEGIAACASGRPPRPRPAILDTAMMTPDGRVEIFRYARRYILDHYLTKSLRCRECIHDAACEGMHINYVRAHGYQVMRPVRDQADAAAE
jgi:MoaA/NifB/PqqE/SkfB family radical SAM enzyme